MKDHKSPFRQLNRAIYLLRKQIPGKVWVNPIVFFENDDLEEVSVFSDHIWFANPQKLLDYIRNEGKGSFVTESKSFFEKCISADCLYDNKRKRFLRCVINRASLRFKTRQGLIPDDDIKSVRIVHHWTYDELYVQTTDGSVYLYTHENGKIEVDDYGDVACYALCNLDYIELGRALNR